MFSATFHEGKGDELLGGPPDPEHDNEENIISVFINKVINPEKPFGSSVSHMTCSLSHMICLPTHNHMTCLFSHMICLLTHIACLSSHMTVVSCS